MTDQGPRVIDFGIAGLKDVTSVTSTGVLVGSPSWLSPEQVRGDAVEAPSDVFNWGCVLVYAATGTGPFRDGTVDALLYRVLHEDADLGSKDALTPPLVPLVRRALNKLPGERPTAQEVVDRLAGPTSVESPRSPVAPRPPAPHRHPRSPRGAVPR